MTTDAAFASIVAWYTATIARSLAKGFRALVAIRILCHLIHPSRVAERNRIGLATFGVRFDAAANAL